MTRFPKLKVDLALRMHCNSGPLNITGHDTQCTDSDMTPICEKDVICWNVQTKIAVGWKVIYKIPERKTCILCNCIFCRNVDQGQLLFAPRHKKACLL